MKRLLAVTAILLLATSSVLAATASKDGTPVQIVPSSVTPTSPMRFDWVYNSGGSAGFVPDLGGSATGWGEYFIVTVLNNSGSTVVLEQLGFPCCGAPTSTYGWLVWTGMSGYVAPSGSATTAEYYGAFAPLDPSPSTFPPTVYTYVDVSAENIAIAAGEYFTVGYDVTGIGGQTSFNGTQTWAWYLGTWDPDVAWGRTAIIEVAGSFGATPTETSTWSQIKGLFR